MRHAIRRTVVVAAMLGCGALAACGGGGTSSGAGGGGGASAQGLNGCDPATAEDHTTDASVTITSMGTSYSPACIKIKVGTMVTFDSAFSTHPLRGGTIANGAKTPDGSSPIANTDSGTSASFTFSKAGDFGFYCDVHGLSGMAGAVFVQ